MPRLSPLQWLILALFLAFYGFAVFALTRDYYLRNPSQIAATSPPSAQSPHALPQAGQRTWIQGAMQDGGDIIPPAVTETNPVLLNQTADGLFAQKRYAEAIALYQRVLELDPEDIDAHNDLGLALYYAGQPQAALELLKEGTGKRPDFQRIWLTLGFVSARAGDKPGAQEALEKARALGADNSVGQEAARMLGLLQGDQGEP
ncbi:MAG: tetratricopeptide repeat protein [Pseudomonadota bacterium]|nr:tetratricopeptide repeat protein [Pseudomonadota bacterium]